MSQIDKLAILGVRSFDIGHMETIQFHAPLTLIVGYNGSGKTTIIECLKYATTGDLPPNSKGGAFIHDPKICGEKEVLAQVKLSFRSVDGAKMVCTRSLQLTVKKATRQQKTLESQLLVVKNGERSSVSSRCVDMDTVMPQYLGVSKAVLDYVIFCHQDESLWPMSEPAALKKRFDEIFEALKYTKAIDNIKALVKTQKIELGKLNIMLDNYKIDKDRAEKAEKKCERTVAEIDDLKAKHDLLEAEIKENELKLDELRKAYRDVPDAINELNSKRQMAVQMDENLKELREELAQLEDLDEVAESDEQLRQMRLNYGERVKQLEVMVTAKVARQNTVRQNVKSCRERQDKKNREVGRALSDKSRYENDLAEREKLVKNLSRRHNIRGYDDDLNDEMVTEFYSKLAEKHREQKEKLETLKAELRTEREEAQTERNKLLAQQNSLLQKKEYARADIASRERKMVELRRRLEDVNVDGGQKAMAQAKLDDCNQRLKEAREAFNRSDYDGKIRELNNKLHDVKDRYRKATEELGRSTKQSEARAKIGIWKKEVESRDKAIETLMLTHEDKFNKTLPGWTPETLENSLRKVLSRREEDLSEANRDKESKNVEVSNIEGRASAANDALKRKKRERDDARERVKRVCEDEVEPEHVKDPNPDEYEEYVRLYEERLENEKNNLGSLVFLKDYLQKAIKYAEDKGECALCRIPLEETERGAFMKRTQAMLERLAKRDITNEIAAVENILESLKKVRPLYDNYIRLEKTEIPQLEKDAQKFAGQRSRAMNDLEEAVIVAAEKGADKDEAEALRKPIQDLLKYRKEKADFEENIARSSSQLNDMGGSKTVEEMQKEIHELGSETDALRNKIQELSTEKDTQRQDIVFLDNAARDAKASLREVDHRLEIAKQLNNQVDEHRSTIAEQKDVMVKLDAELKSMTPHLTKAEAKLQDVEEKGTEKESKHQETTNDLSRSLTQLRDAGDVIAKYRVNGKAQELERLQRESREMQQELSKLIDEDTETSTEITRIHKEQANVRTMEHTLLQHIKCRESQAKLDVLNTEIRTLEAQNIEAKLNDYEKQKRRLNNEYTNLLQRRAELVSKIADRNTQLEDLMREFELDYKDAKDNYRSGMIKVTTTKAAIDDLTKYAAALDKAVMKYHSLKMEEINRIIEELWKATYRGTDVDTILIRSDSESQKGNRSYNYRVCMVKQDAELDMRGRCSAGQRVLASIIIRLALAECFGTNCGLIALDEPTTNLDSDNIRSLAQSLADIIEQRRQQKNFQLIVITHDEEFLRYMRPSDFTDSYYRVSRDDRQKSVVERVEIADLQ